MLIHMPSVFAVANNEKWLWWSWVSDNTSLILKDLRVHVILTVLAVVIGFAIALPLGIWCQRHRKFYGPVLGVTGVLYTIPSLAAFALLVPYLGPSTATALIPLVAYTLLILLRNVVTGLDGVPDESIAAADALGYTERQRLVRVELPLALPAIMAGVRIATVTTVGLLTIAAIVGLDGLGQLFSFGLSNPMRTAITVGAVLAVAVAIVADLMLVGLQHLLTPWSRRAQT